jgi:hypothetical protein
MAAGSAWRPAWLDDAPPLLVYSAQTGLLSQQLFPAARQTCCAPARLLLCPSRLIFLHTPTHHPPLPGPLHKLGGRVPFTLGADPTPSSSLPWQGQARRGGEQFSPFPAREGGWGLGLPPNLNTPRGWVHFTFGANPTPSSSLPWQGQARRGGEQFSPFPAREGGGGLGLPPNLNTPRGSNLLKVEGKCVILNTPANPSLTPGGIPRSGELERLVSL